MFSRFFIDRPIFATVLSVLITLGGALGGLQSSLGTISAGHAADGHGQLQLSRRQRQVVAETVAAPIEQQVNGVENMLYMSSQCTNDGTYSLSVTFKHGVNLNLAQVLVQNRVNLALPMLPDVLKRTGVTTRKMSPDILMSVNLTSPHGRFDQLYLSNYALIYIRDELLRLPGISDIFISGQHDYSMRIWVDPEQLASRNLTADDVVNAIRQQNADIACGQIGQQPVPPGQETQITLSTLGRLKTPQQFADIILRATPDGNVTRIRDIGRVELASKSEDISARLDQKADDRADHFPIARRQRFGNGRLDPSEDGRTGEELSRRPGVRNSVRHDALHAGVHQRGVQVAARRDHPRGPGGDAVSAKLAFGGHSADCRAGGHRRHLWRHVAVGLQPQQPDAFRPGAGHRHRG